MTEQVQAGGTIEISLFAHFIGANAPLTLPGAPFLLAGALLLAALVIACLRC